MAYVTSLFARKMVAAAGSGIDGRAMLELAGVDPDAAWDPKVMIEAVRYYEMLEAMAEEIDVSALPVQVGASMRCDEYGALGLAWKAAPTLGASCARIVRYARIWTGIVTYELRAHPRGTLFVLHREGPRRLGLRLSNEATLASAVSLVRQVCPVPFSPLEVFHRHDGPPSAAFHAAWYGCPVSFGADLDAVLISDAAMARGNILGDEGISGYLVPHLDRELAEAGPPPTVVGQAKALIAQGLSEGKPQMAEVARSLGLSARSFHRRLSGEGISFQGLLEETRRELAEGLLRDPGHSLAEVAFLTGFSEQSAFTRAFRRWLGTTPARYRRDRMSGV